MKKTAILLGIILCIVLSWDYYNFKQEGERIVLDKNERIQVNSVSSISFSDAGMTVECDSTNDAFLIVPLPAKTHFWKRLQLDLKNLKGINAVEIFYREIDDKGFTRMPKRYVSGYVDDTFSWYLPPGEYSQLRIDFDGHQVKAKPIISEIRLMEFSFFFACEAYLYLLAILVFGMFILPGTLMYAITAKDSSQTARNNLLYLFSNSLIFYFILYLVEIAALETGVSSTLTVTIALILFLGGLLVAVKIRGRKALVLELFQKERKAFIASIIVIIISCIFITKFTEEPFTYASVNHNTLDRLTIFSHFPGHDNQFQFINGKAIADDEPFSKYYSHKRLFYEVQDRGMLPGVIYSVFRTFFTTFSTYIGSSYLTYTLVGLCMNVMVLLSLIVLFRRYFPERYVNVFLLLLCLNTFVFPNFYFTWFKFSGAALFISGVLLVLDSRKKVGNWLAAGFMFGLASSMHAGNALAIPPIFLWFVGLSIYEFSFFSRQVFLFPLGLTIMFVLTNLPWSIVKSLNFPDTHALIIQHYFPARKQPTLGATILRFFEIHPLKEQLEFRLGNVIDMVRLTEFGKCFDALSKKGVNQFIEDYNNYQFFFFMFSVVPLFCITILSKLFSGLFAKGKLAIDRCKDTTGIIKHEALTLFAVSMFTIVALTFVAYSDLPDLNHALPAGTILIIHTLLLGWILNAGRAGHLLIGVYAVFSAWRMITHALLFIFI